MTYYVMTVKLATGADKYLVMREQPEGWLVVYDKWDELTGALAMCEYLNKEGEEVT